MDFALADRVHGNLMSVSSWMGEAPGGAVHDCQGELFFASPSALPFLNGAMRRRSAEAADELLDRARSFFFPRHRGFVAFAWPGDPAIERAAQSAGMVTVIDRYPEMVRAAPLAQIVADVRQVETEDEAIAYWEICDVAYPSLGFPPGVFAEAFAATDLLDAERVGAFVAYDDGRAAACASVWMTRGVGMVGWVAAVPDARGRGLAAASTVRATNHAFDAGCEVASLQASSMGEAVYRRLGYEELYSYRMFGAMPD